MALNWTKLFGDLGKIIARANSYETLAGTTLETDLTTLITQFGTVWHPTEGIAATYEGYQGQVKAWREALASLAARRLTDEETVLTQLGLGPVGITQVLPELVAQMWTEGKMVKACATSLGTVTTRSTPPNNGTGQAFPTLTLDGYNAPRSGALPSIYYDGRVSELCVSETMTLECVADSQQSGLPEGSEIFRWRGGPDYGDWDWRGEGSGEGPGVPCANSYAMILGSTMETFTSNVPSGWTLASGTAGTHCLRDTGTYFRGTSSLKLVGNSGTVRLTQALSPTLVQGRRRYHLGLAVRGTGISAATVLTVKLSGTGWTPLTTEQIILTGPSQIGSMWNLVAANFSVPAVIPSDLTVTIQLEAPPGASVWIDNLTFAPLVYHGGVGLAIVAGEKPWLRGDRLTFTVTNDNAGKFQTFFRRAFRTQLPSRTATTTRLTGLLSPWVLMSQATVESPADTLVS